MRDEARRLLASEGFPAERQDIRAIAEVKYLGQMTTLPIGIAGAVTAESLDGVVEDFAAAHEQAYGYRSPKERLQVVAIKVLGRGLPATPRVPDSVVPSREQPRAGSTRRAYFGPEHGWIDTPLLARAELGAAARKGPAIIEEYDSTTVVRPGWTLRLDAWNNIVMERV
jgi:N-methylhydantoinase A